MEYEPLDADVVTRPKMRSIEAEPASAEADLDHADLGPQLAAPAAALGPAAVIGLQRSAGNSAVTALLQRKLAEAEEAEAEEEEPISPVLDVVGKGGGEPLNSELRDEMEARLGDDFSDVRVHSDPSAASSAAAVSARAYTVGNDIVLGEGVPALDSDQGKHTLAHELTHVVQQRKGPVAGTPTGDGISISDPSDRFEQAAERTATQVMSAGTPSLSTAGPAGSHAQRELADGEESEADNESELVEEEVPEEVESGEGEEEEEAPVQGLWVQRDETEDQQTELEVEANSQEMEKETEADEAAAEAEDQASEMETEEEEAEAEANTEAEEAEEESEA